MEKVINYNKQANMYKLISDVIVLVSSLFSIIYIVYNNEHEGYKLFFLLPLTFIVVYLLILNKIIFYRFRFFIMSFSFISFMRYVIMPVMIVFSGYYGGRSVVSPTSESYKRACLLMCYELIIISIVILILEKRRNKETSYIKMSEKKIKLSKNNFIYLSFFMLSILVIIIVPESLNLFSIITPRLTGTEYLQELGFKVAIATYILFTAKHLIYILTISMLYKRFKKTNKRIYRNIAFLVTIINISIFYGLNRSDLLIPACASIIIYMILFKDKNIFKYIIIAIAVLTLVISIGNSRNIASISKNKSKIVDIADFMQGYLGGVYNVAISLETYEYYPEVRSLPRLAYDTFRPFIGVNIFLKNVNMDFTNTYFNKRIYFNDHTAQIVPMIGQGYLQFGYILSPILGCLIVYIAYLFEDVINKASRIEIIYFVSICLIRMGFFMGQNTGNIANEISMNLVMFIIIYLLNNKIVYKKEGKKNV